MRNKPLLPSLLLIFFCIASSTSLAQEKEEPKGFTTEQFRNFRASVVPGNSAHEFTYTNIDGDSVSLSDFKGSLIYIDLWATWCGPCIAEMPKWKRLKKWYKKENIVFLSISMDKDKNAWESYVKKKKLKGHQLWAGGPLSEPIFYYTIYTMDEFIGGARDKEEYVTAIPTFIFIDKEGNIINNRAPKPSDPNIQKTLDELLEK